MKHEQKIPTVQDVLKEQEAGAKRLREETGGALVPLAPVSDGWLVAASEARNNLVRGQLCTFSDWRWCTRDGNQIEPTREFAAVGTAMAWVRWQDRNPVETLVAEPGRLLPDRNTLGHLDESKWERGPDGQPRDPYANSRFVWLLDVKTAESLTFTTSSYGGRAAVADLAEAIMRMRSAHPHCSPVVKLEAAAMPTRFGRKSKPIFKITDWKGLSPVPQVTPPKALGAEMDDAVPFAPAWW